MTLQQGLHFDVPMDDYVADPAPDPSLNKSSIKNLIESTPRHTWYKHTRLNPDYRGDDSARADLGSAVHALVLGGKPLAVVDAKDWRTKAARDEQAGAWDEGRIPILKHQETKVNAAAMAAIAYLHALPSWPDAPDKIDIEGTLVWQSGGAWKRGRFDMWCQSANKMVDIKTVGSAEPNGWARTSLRAGGYDIQAEHYLEGMRVLGKANAHTQFLFLLVEIEPPFCCSFVGLDPAYEDFAQRKIKMATKLWNKCLADNDWPGYTTMTHWIEPSAWDEAAVADKSWAIKGALGGDK